MKNIYKIALIALLFGSFYGCQKSDNVTAPPPRPYEDVYPEDLAKIEDFLSSHYVTVDADFNTTFTEIEVGGTETSIMDMPELQSFDVTVQAHGDLTYKVYYLNFQEGVNESTTRVDSAFVSYKGFSFYETSTFNETTNETEYSTEQVVFDQRINPVWFSLEDVVRGWGEVIPKFKTGNFTENANGSVSFSDFGAGVMFLPSGLGYYNQGTGSINPYSPLVFTFKLCKQRSRDHDRDGILSKDEYGTDFTVFANDTDGDGLPDYLDQDDDGDGKLTKNEVKYDLQGNVEFPYADCDNDGIPNYLDSNDIDDCL